MFTLTNEMKYITLSKRKSYKRKPVRKCLALGYCEERTIVNNKQSFQFAKFGMNIFSKTMDEKDSFINVLTFRMFCKQNKRFSTDH